jgi:branched-chain amino acid transport system permease protein
MEVFVQQLINGLTLGSIYGLIAIGYTMVFGIIGMVNFAHGDVFMLSAFIALIFFLLLTTWLGIGSVIAALLVVLLIAMLLTALWGWALERIAYRPLRGSFACAADLRHRRVDRAVELRPGGAGRRNKPTPPMVRDVIPLFERNGYVVALSYKQIIIMVVTACCSASSGIWCRRPRSAARSAPASRTARWRRCSASMSTAPISLTFVMGAAWRRSPARCTCSITASCPSTTASCRA